MAGFRGKVTAPLNVELGTFSLDPAPESLDWTNDRGLGEVRTKGEPENA